MIGHAVAVRSVAPMKPPRPAIYDDILGFGIRNERSEEQVTARLGGFWAQPNYALSYLLAASVAIENVRADQRESELVLPIAFLQRHAFELAIKDVADAAFEVACDSIWIETLKGDTSAQRPEQRRIPSTHDLLDLVGVLRKALASAHHGDVPADIVEMAQRLTDTEGARHDRLRYPRLRTGEKSFADEVTFNVGKTQADLEALFGRHFQYRAEYDDNQNVVTSLAHEAEAAFQALQRLLPLDRL